MIQKIQNVVILVVLKMMVILNMMIQIVLIVKKTITQYFVRNIKHIIKMKTEKQRKIILCQNV